MPAASTQTYPSQILIIRHGEKLGNPSKDDSQSGPALSIQGSARASALASLFAPAQNQLSCGLAQSGTAFTGSYAKSTLSGKTPRFATPDFIFATKKSAHSNRPVETITPLAAALNMTYDDKHSDQHYTKVAHDVLNNSKYAGKVVLICWHHGKIPDLAKALGVAKPPHWKGTVFDRVWQITYSSGAATLNKYAQMLLFGDSKKA